MMAPDPKTPDSASDDHADRAQAIIDEVISRRAAGDEIMDDEVLAAHPDLADQLADRLRQLRLIQAAGDQAQHKPFTGTGRIRPDADLQATIDHADPNLERIETQESISLSLKVLCPHCQESVEVVLDKILLDITCDSCRVVFNLAADIANASWVRDGSLATVHIIDLPCSRHDDSPTDKSDEMTSTLAFIESRAEATPATAPFDRVRPRAKEAPSGVYQSTAVMRFQVIDQLARGGLGIVSIAHDTELSRKVALKEIKPRFAQHEESRARFLQEAEITGRLEHPGVVPIYGLGSYPDGRLYYAMRLIHGKTLQEAILEYHEPSKVAWQPGARNLAFRQLLTQFIAVCRTVAYAHNRGVLHRDIKPANIMLGKFGETIVVDWGLAKLVGRPDVGSRTEESVLVAPVGGGSTATKLGSALGTPQYMSPEQASGLVDELNPRTDVYSLGATLFMLLTGEPPFRGSDIAITLAMVRNGEFQPPRKVATSSPRILEAVCLKAMSREPIGRYESAIALAEDVEHYLADEPVVAYCDSATEHVGRWLRRHRGWSIAAAVTLVTVAAVSLVAVIYINAARQRAEQMSIERDEQRRLALRRFQQSQDALNLWLTGASNALEFYPGTQRVRARLLEQAAKNLEDFAVQAEDDLEMQIERGRAYLRLGDVRKMLDDSEAAAREYDRAKATLEHVIAQHGDSVEARVELANCHSKIALAYAGTSRLKDAENHYQTALTELRKLRNTQPDQENVRDALATSLLNRADLLIDTGNMPEAQKSLRMAIDEYTGLIQLNAEQPRYSFSIATGRGLLGRTLIMRGQYAAALAEFETAIATFEELVRSEQDNPRYLEALATTRMLLAEASNMTGDYSRQLNSYKEAVTSYERLVRAVPDIHAYWEDLAIARTNLGQLNLERGSSLVARAELEQAKLVFRQLTDANVSKPRYYEHLAACGDLLGCALHYQEQFEAARDEIRQAVDVFDGLLAGRDNEVQLARIRQRRAVAASHLAQLLSQLGRPDEAKRYFDDTIASLSQLSKDDPENTEYENQLAFVHLYRGNWEADKGNMAAARQEHKVAKTLWEQLAKPRDAVDYQHNLARLLVACESIDLRDPLAAVALAQKLVDEKPQNTTFRETLAEAYFRAEKWDECIAAVLVAQRKSDGGHARQWYLLALAQWKSNRSDDARSSLDRGNKWLAEHQPGRRELLLLKREAAGLIRDGNGG